GRLDASHFPPNNSSPKEDCRKRERHQPFQAGLQGRYFSLKLVSFIPISIHSPNSVSVSYRINMISDLDIRFVVIHREALSIAASILFKSFLLHPEIRSMIFVFLFPLTSTVL